MDGGKLAIKGPSIPAVRIKKAIQRVAQAFEAVRVDGERFFNWAHQVGAERFDVLLADLARVAPCDVSSVAHDHRDVADCRVVSLGGGECASATDMAVARYFLDAVHERSY